MRAMRLRFAIIFGGYAVKDIAGATHDNTNGGLCLEHVALETISTFRFASAR
jgi:hypothetical protein